MNEIFLFTNKIIYIKMHHNFERPKINLKMRHFYK